MKLPMKKQIKVLESESADKLASPDKGRVGYIQLLALKQL